MKTPAENRGDGGGRDEAEQGELFERHLTATYPSPNTRAADTLRDLLAGHRLRQSERLGRGWRLAAEVFTLHCLGWPIEDRPIHIEGRRRPIKEYWLPGWVLRELAAGHE